VKECDCNYVTEGKFRTWLLQCKIPGFVPVRVSDTYRIRYPHRYPCNIARDGRGGGKASLPTGVMVAAHGWAPPPRQHAFSAFLYLSLKVGGQWQTAMTTATSRRSVLLPVVTWPVLPPPLARACRRPAAAPSPTHHRATIAPSRGWIDSWWMDRFLAPKLRCRTGSTFAIGRTYNGAEPGGKAWEHEPSSSFRETTARSSPG
jgi:hypothetical protein